MSNNTSGLTFRALFFRTYDRQIANGVCTFSQLGIPKTDFTTLCTNPDFRLRRETLVRAIEKMKLSEEEAKELISKYDAEAEE